MGRPPKITDAQILSAARQVFLDQGPGASTLEIAKLAGIAEASIFKRFATKQDLFMAAIGIDTVPAWITRLERGVPPVDFKAELTAICREMLAFYQEVLPRVLMMMAPGILMRSRQFVPPPIRDSHLLAAFLQRASEQGQIRDCDSYTMAHLVVGGIHNHVVSQMFREKSQKGLEVSQSKSSEATEFINSLVEILWSNLAPE